MELEKGVKCAFKKIMYRYNMQFAVVSENEVVLFTNKFILSFLCRYAELIMVYFEKTEDGELYQYNIDSFIASSIATEDRVRIKERYQKESKLVVDLETLACTLEKKWSDLLSGGKEWIKEYENFFLYIPVRNVTEPAEKIYRGKCI